MQPNNFFSLKQIIDSQPLTVAADTPVTEVVRQMQEWGNSCYLANKVEILETDTIIGSDSSCVLVVENSQLRGIFTERDLVKLIASDANINNLKVAEVMSQQVITLRATDSPDIFTALNTLRQHHLRHLPVVDADNNLLGLITTKSLRQQLQPINLMKWRKVEEVMETEVIQAAADDSVRHIAGLMANYNISCVAIAESVLEGETNNPLVCPVGIITERDIVQFQNLNLDLEQPARNLMSTPLFLVSPEDTLWSIHQQMQQHRIRRLLVGGERGELRGIITQTSLLQVFDTAEMYGLIDILQRQVCQLEIEKTQLFENRQAELEQEINKRISELAKTNQILQQESEKRQKATLKFSIQAKQQKAVAEFGQFALAEQNIDSLIERAVNLVTSTLEVEYSKVLELLPDGKNLLLKAGAGWQEGRVGVATVRADINSQAGYTLFSTEPVVVEDLRLETRFSGSSLLLDHQVISGMNAIISGNDKPYGILGIHSTQHHVFSQDDVNFLQAIANILAQALERHQVELTLKRSERKFKAIFDQTFQFIGLLEPDGTLIEANKTALDFVGLTPVDVVGKPFWETPWWSMSKETQEHLKQAINRAAQGEFIRFEVEHPGIEDRLVTVDFSLTPVRDETGKVIMLIPEGRNISELKQVEANLHKSNQILQAISWIQTQFLADAKPQILFDGMLERLLELTESEYGFIGEILFTADGSPIMEESYMKFRGIPYLKTHAITNIAWNEETRAFYAENAPKGMEFHNLQTLFGAVIVTGEPVIANSPSSDPRRGGLPEGHPPLNAFLGVPFYKETEMIGMVGIANRQEGYDRAMIDYLQPFLDTCTRIIEAYRSERSKKQAEEQIRQQATLLDVATDAIMVRALDDRILFWNQGAVRLYDWTTAEALNQNANQLLYRQPLTELSQIQQTVKDQGEWQGELNQVTKAGKNIVVKSRWTLVTDEAGNPQSYLVVNTDITEQKLLETQFLRTQRLESLGTLAGGIAHDLNNILVPILGFAKLLPLKLPQVDEQTKGFFKIIETNAQRGSALVKQILTFSRGLEGDRGIVQIRHLIAEIEQIIRETFPKSIELAINTPKTLWTVNGDVNQLHQVLMNLTVNARDAMLNGGKLTITAENITVDTDYARLYLDAAEGSYVLISVTDTGMGIPAEIIDRIFEPFFTTKEIGQGTGLGLSTVIGIVKSHGGFVDVISNNTGESKGTQVKVFLPAAETTANSIEEVEPLPQGNGELILVVDDESSILEVTKATLEIYNYQVLTAQDGIEAIAVYAHNLNSIKAVIMDMMMPKMDGKTAILALKQINPAVPIIAVSGLVSSQEMIGEIDERVAAFLVKPYSNDDLLRAIAEVINLSVQ